MWLCSIKGDKRATGANRRYYGHLAGGIEFSKSPITYGLFLILAFHSFAIARISFSKLAHFPKCPNQK